MHINLVLTQYNENIFFEKGNGMSKTAQSFIAGILRRAAEMTVFFNPLSNSYARFGAYEAPSGIDWSYGNPKTLVRLLLPNNKRARVDFRSPDPVCNPYIGFALLVYAGLEGIEDGLELQEANEQRRTENGAMLPQSLAEAIEIAKNSEFIKKSLPDLIYRNYLAIKTEEMKKSLQSAEYRQEQEEKHFQMI